MPCFELDFLAKQNRKDFRRFRFWLRSVYFLFRQVWLIFVFYKKNDLGGIRTYAEPAGTHCVDAQLLCLCAITVQSFIATHFNLLSNILNPRRGENLSMFNEGLYYLTRWGLNGCGMSDIVFAVVQIRYSTQNEVMLIDKGCLSTIQTKSPVRKSRFESAWHLEHFKEGTNSFSERCQIAFA